MVQRKTRDCVSALKIWPLILTWFCILAIPEMQASVQDGKRDLLRQSIQSYYSLRRLGLLEFRANVQPNWVAMAKDTKGNPEAMKMLNGLRFLVSLRPDGSVKVDYESAAPIPTAQEGNIKQIYAGMDEMLTGFFATWNLFMLTSPFPAAESEYQLQDLGEKYLLTYKEGSTDVSTTMTREFGITEVKVSAEAFKASVKPQFTKTPKGYVLVGYEGSYEPTVGPGKTRLSVRVEYQEINGFQLPRKLNLDGIYDGSLVQAELQFSQYLLKTQ